MKQILLTITLFLTTQTANAWLYFEPYIGYNRGQNQATRIQGLGFGTRLGFEFSNLFVVGDVGYHDLQQSTISSAKYTHIGATLGGKVHNFRIWYGMISSSSYTYKSGATDIKYKGSGSKIGLGTELGNKTYLNMELYSIDYTENENNGTVTPISEIATIGLFGLGWVF